MTPLVFCRWGMANFTIKEFPEGLSLQDLDDPPQKLYFSGDKSLLQKPMISVVGARQMSPATKEWMEYELAPCLKQLGCGVVSGGARGVDQWAHLLALRQQLPTVVVLPSGLNQKYPRELEKWSHHPHLLFLSEYEEDQLMRKHHFYGRNRLVVGLTSLTLVVQAKERSGTMISAGFARDYGKTLATLPGHPLDPQFSGNNQLLYDGAALVRNGKDLMALINSSFCAAGSGQREEE